MKIKFDISDETTVTNTTVKLTVWISGTISGKSRETLEAESLKLAKTFFDLPWAFSNFTYNADGFTFRVQGNTRIDSQLNDQLPDRAKLLASDALKLEVQNIDTTIPVHDIRAAESRLRERIIKLANEEAVKLGGRVEAVEFTSIQQSGYSNAKSAFGSATYAASSESAGARGVLGHSEKYTMEAAVTVRSRGSVSDEVADEAESA